MNQTDKYPYTATWNSLTPQQKRFVSGRAKRAKVSIPDILDIDIKAQREWRKNNAPSTQPEK